MVRCVSYFTRGEGSQAHYLRRPVRSGIGGDENSMTQQPHKGANWHETSNCNTCSGRAWMRSLLLRQHLTFCFGCKQHGHGAHEVNAG